jgi:hypothetical protein
MRNGDIAMQQGTPTSSQKMSKVGGMHVRKAIGHHPLAREDDVPGGGQAVSTFIHRRKRCRKAVRTGSCGVHVSNISGGMRQTKQGRHARCRHTEHLVITCSLRGQMHVRHLAEGNASM